MCESRRTGRGRSPSARPRGCRTVQARRPVPAGAAGRDPDLDYPGCPPRQATCRQPDINPEQRRYQPDLAHPHRSRLRPAPWRGLVNHRTCRVRTTKSAIAASISMSRNCSATGRLRGTNGWVIAWDRDQTDRNHSPGVKTHHPRNRAWALARRRHHSEPRLPPSAPSRSVEGRGLVRYTRFDVGVAPRAGVIRG